MDKITQLLPDVICWTMPKGAIDISVVWGQSAGTHKDQMVRHRIKNEGYGAWHYYSLPPGNWQILFQTREAREEDTAKLVRKSEEYKGVWIYYDYVDGKALHTALESFHSLLRSKGLSDTGNYLILTQSKNGMI